MKNIVMKKNSLIKIYEIKFLEFFFNCKKILLPNLGDKICIFAVVGKHYFKKKKKKQKTLITIIYDKTFIVMPFL